MSSAATTPSRTALGHGSTQTPGQAVSREELLRDFFELQDRLDTLTEALAALAIGSPATAVLLNMGLEKSRRRAGYHRLLAARAAQYSLAHELPVETLNELRDISEHPADFAAGDAALPEDPCGVPSGRLPHKDTAELLQNICSIGYFEARDRLEAVRLMLPGAADPTSAAPPRFPLLAAQLRAGNLRPVEATRAASRLEKLRPEISGRTNASELAASIEEKVLDSLLTQGPAATAKLLKTVETELEDAPAPTPTAEQLAAKTGFRLTRRTEHLTYFTLTMTNLDAELVLSHFALSDNPRTSAGNREGLASDAAAVGTPPRAESLHICDGERTPHEHLTSGNPAPSIPEWAVAPNTPPDERPRAEWTDLGLAAQAHQGSGTGTPSPTNGHPEPAAPASRQTSFGEADDATEAPDGLSPARRRLQTLLNIMRAAGGPGGSGGKRTTGLPQARLIVYCHLATLLGLSEKAGITQHGLEVSPGDLRRELCNAGVIPLVLNGESQILDVGREQRFVPDHMRQAVLARDGGCLVPGCTVPPEHLEMCHVKAWADGGTTSIANTGPGCTNHHHGFHTGQYKLVLNEQGLPAVILPRYLDPSQKPRRNAHWQQQTLTDPMLF
ncbi:hypothetical protein ACSYDW_02810 [Paeniglutamicibacter sp. R2-26]|uniref:HNH endonuclease signature motif containing protein n=1 Tax=Paeniglutamicibacter sp. R2-26 TaxID=3144417 RepID=UPI003EE6E026